MCQHAAGPSESKELLPEEENIDRTNTFEVDVQVDPEPLVHVAPAAPTGHGAPLWAWALLAAAVLAVSSAGVVFAMMPEVPSLTLAGWRLQLTSVFLGMAASVQFCKMPGDLKRRTLRKGGLLALSGCILAVHFGSWVYSVHQTSLSHSLLFVSSTPLILAGGAWLLRKPISRGELVGTGVGLVGAVLLATAAAKSDQQVTLHGDMAALLAAFAFVGYLLIGQNLRSWMPVFVYAFAVTGLAAVLLTLAAMAFEGAQLLQAGTGGCFGWAADTRYLPKVLYLAAVPGILGHQGFNTLLRYLPPLIITLALNVEPLIGSFMGWLVGVTAPPGPWTYVGGALVMTSTVAVTLASHRREKSAAAAKHQYERLVVDDALDEALSWPAQGKREETLWPAGTLPADTAIENENEEGVLEGSKGKPGGFSRQQQHSEDWRRAAEAAG